MVQILALTPTPEQFNQMADVYREAFAGPPYHESLADVLTFAARLPYHARHPAFKCVLALHETKEEILGFAYGYDSLPDNWWRMQVSAEMEPAMAKEWLSDCFELVELAVLPEQQGKGIGGRLHDALLAGIPRRTAVLSTAEAETPALRLYRRRGWLTLMEHFNFPGAPLPFLIMGRRLGQK